MSTTSERVRLVRSENGVDYYVDTKYPHRGEFSIPSEAIQSAPRIFPGSEPATCPVRTEMRDGVPVTICPPYEAQVRSIASSGAGLSLGNGGFKRGSGIGTN
jgi:hypothetical protein